MERARELWAQAWTISEIVAEPGVSGSRVSLWVRDVDFDEAARAPRASANRRLGARKRGPNRLQLRKQADQFGTPYQAVPDPSIRRSKHPLGCPAVSYASSVTHRDHGARTCAVTLRGLQSGVAQLVEQSAVNRKVCGFDPHPRSSRVRAGRPVVRAAA
jgi:hypothetical protein